jgi:hypothetical protein
MMWHLLAMNPEAIAGLYAVVPPLTQLTVVRLQLDSDGPRLQIDCDLSTFPDHPPSRWLRDGSNVAQLKLDCLGVSDIKIDGGATNPVLDLEFTKLSDREILVRGTGQSCQISLRTEFVRIAGVHGYAKAKR